MEPESNVFRDSVLHLPSLKMTTEKIEIMDVRKITKIVWVHEAFGSKGTKLWVVQRRTNAGHQRLPAQGQSDDSDAEHISCDGDVASAAD
jgi:hypothetical protein